MVRDQMLMLFNRQQNEKGILLSEIPKRYADVFATPLIPNEYGYNDLKEILNDLDAYIEVSEFVCFAFFSLELLYFDFFL